jgi:site-specific DNA-methyltransferase (adenine-specific)
MRIIRCCSNPDDLVLDPFSGSATTLVVAKKLGRRWIGFDLSADYIERGTARIAAAEVGAALVGAPEPLVSAPATPAVPRPRNPKKPRKPKESAPGLFATEDTEKSGQPENS